MEKIRETLLRHKGVLVTDFDGTLTLSGSSLHAAVKVLGPDSGLARRAGSFVSHSWKAAF